MARWPGSRWGGSTIRSPSPLLPGNPSALSRPLCHDRLSPLRSRTLKLSVTGDARVTGVPAHYTHGRVCPLHTWACLPTAHMGDSIARPFRGPSILSTFKCPALALSCRWSQCQQLSDVTYLLVFSFTSVGMWSYRHMGPVCLWLFLALERAGT